MDKSERFQLVAPCGLDCGNCEVYLSRDNPELKAFLINAGIPGDKLPCDGCRPMNGDCAVLPEECATYTCAEGREVKYCSDCGDFPCNHLAPASDQADKLPHNTKVFNLCVIKRDGVEAFIGQSGRIKDAYYKGKMVVGSGPKLEE